MYADSEAEAREPPRLRDQGRKVNRLEAQECLRNGEKARVGASGSRDRVKAGVRAGVRGRGRSCGTHEGTQTQQS